MTDGPYDEIEELFDGFWIVEAADLAAATALAADAPLADGMHLEVRRIHGEADVPSRARDVPPAGRGARERSEHASRDHASAAPAQPCAW
ncbi:YciI family protein [Agrococcus sp. SGAir0287]|uniref:YciI family protein n=1 Tax=Agrococcus sp. SGAir0287 TaxID=2070347 RepID=UPI001586505C|nr:YciI family protein [Agrococcus sp. SGAir0287]